MYEILNHNFINKITYWIYDIIDIFVQKEKIKSFSITIPSHVLYRSKLICSYIETEIHDSFSLDNLVMILYLNFIKDCIRNYNPVSVYNLLNKIYYDSKNIVLSCGDESISIDLDPVKLSSLDMCIAEKDYEKGQLILDELYELYGCRFSFSNLIECLWMDFICSYKNGQNKRAYHSIIKMLKEYFY